MISPAFLARRTNRFRGGPVARKPVRFSSRIGNKLVEVSLKVGCGSRPMGPASSSKSVHGVFGFFGREESSRIDSLQSPWTTCK